MTDKQITDLAAEERANIFYNSIGWETEDGISEDARKWEDLRECADNYVRKCRLRVCNHIPDGGIRILDMASGPIQYQEYLEYSKNFTKRYCVDLSSKALEDAEKKIGRHGVFHCGSFFDIPFEKEYFDCSISLHTIIHIDKSMQERAVRKLIDVTKTGKPIIIVYGNPRTFVKKIKKLSPRKLKKKLMKLISNKHKDVEIRKDDKEGSLYSYHYPLSWWQNFSELADVRIYPWRSFDSDTQKMLFPDNRIGKAMFSLIFILEERFPHFFVKNFQYPMIVLTKK